MKNSKASSSEAGGEDEEKTSFPSRDKVSAALFYGLTSFAVIFTNKSVMTNYNFPYFDFLAFVQFTVTTFILSILVMAKRIDIPLISWPICKEVLPISVMFLGNVICGLGGTRSLNLPMFTALRRFSILMTMIAEYVILGSKPSSPIVVSVMMMVGGALLAAFYDLHFEAVGYSLVFLNNCFTTLNGVWMKKASMSGRCSKIGILFYNSMFSAVAMLVFFICEHLYIQHINQGARVTQSSSFKGVATTSTTEGLAGAVGVASITAVQNVAHRFLAVATAGKKLDLLVAGGGDSSVDVLVGAGASKAVAQHFESTLTGIMAYTGWLKWDFLALFSLAAMMGSILNYSIFLCTTLNSALTTAVIGCLKNVATTYIGMMVFPDYAFEIINFIGLNISIAGSLYYTYMTMFKGMAGFGGG